MYLQISTVTQQYVSSCSTTTAVRRVGISLRGSFYAGEGLCFVAEDARS